MIADALHLESLGGNLFRGGFDDAHDHEENRYFPVPTIIEAAATTARKAAPCLSLPPLLE
jgi:hypothetical protein